MQVVGMQDGEAGGFCGQQAAQRMAGITAKRRDMRGLLEQA
jgi:hypothetical protein